MNKRKILLTLARSGSSWVQQYVNEYNKINFKMNALQDQFEGFEFFNKDNIIFNNITFNSLQEKIYFLEAERLSGKEYSIKVFLDQIEDNHEWFFNFYKDWEIIKLTRRDLFKQFISYTCHTPEFHDLFFKELVTGQRGYIKDFILWQNLLNLVMTDSHLVYEDLTDEFLCSYFKVNLDASSTTHKTNIIYAEKFLLHDYAKEVFNEILVDFIAK